MDEAISTLIQTITNNQYVDQSLLILNEKSINWYIKAKTHIMNLTNLAEIKNLDSVDEKAVDLREIISKPPDPKQFKSEDEFRYAEDQYNKLRRHLNLISKDHLYISVLDFEQLNRFINHIDDVMHIVCSLKGNRLMALVVQRQEIKAGRRAVNLFSRLRGGMEE